MIYLIELFGGSVDVVVMINVLEVDLIGYDVIIVFNGNFCGFLFYCIDEVIDRVFVWVIVLDFMKSKVFRV